MATAAVRPPATDFTTSDASASYPVLEILREITRGGLAGLIVGVVVGGIGGRLVMRLATLLVPDSAGRVTENGNVIGTITFEGTVLLIMFGGLVFGALAGSVWVTIRPWLPDATGVRALMSIPIALAIGTVGLIDADNPDFAILGHDPLVVASLLVLVALFGPALVATESLLDRILPHARTHDRLTVRAYGVVALLGLILTLFLVIPIILGSELTLTGIALLGVGVATLASWWLRIVRARPPGQRLTTAARVSLAIGTAAGLIVSAPDVAGALGVLSGARPAREVAIDPAMRDDRVAMPDRRAADAIAADDLHEVGDRLRELAFLHDIAQLATLARDWDELMRTIVDGTTAAMGVEVCSFYLADREKTRLTLAATNGLDRSQVGRVSLAWGQGITGRVAATREPIAVPDVTVDERFAWVRGFDIEGLAGMLSVPLVWHDEVVGVLNVQTRAIRRFSDDEIALLTTIAALLAGIVEKGRLTAEVEARLAQLTALDAARSELLSVVTHELRTPLSVVRVYVDLLAEAAASMEPADAAPAWREAANDQLARLDRLVDSILASVRGEGLTGLSRAPFDAVAAVDETVETLRLLLRPHPIRWDRAPGEMIAIGDEGRFRQVLEQLLENESKYAPTADGVSIGIWRVDGEIQVYVTDDGPGVPIDDWESVFEPFVRVEGQGRGRSRGSGIGLFAARRLMTAMGGRIFIEPNGYASSRFVVALPAG